MKRTILLITFLFTVTLAMAEYRMLQKEVTVTYGSTNTYAWTAVIGKPVGIAIGGSTNITVAVTAKDGFGMSLNGDRAIYSVSNISSTNTTPTAVLLYLDKVEIAVSGSNGVAQVKLLLED